MSTIRIQEEVFEGRVFRDGDTDEGPSGLESITLESQ